MLLDALWLFDQLSYNSHSFHICPKNSLLGHQYVSFYSGVYEAKFEITMTS